MHSHRLQCGPQIGLELQMEFWKLYITNFLGEIAGGQRLSPRQALLEGSNVVILPRQYKQDIYASAVEPNRLEFRSVHVPING